MGHGICIMHHACALYGSMAGMTWPAARCMPCISGSVLSYTFVGGTERAPLFGPCVIMSAGRTRDRTWVRPLEALEPKAVGRPRAPIYTSTCSSRAPWTRARLEDLEFHRGSGAGRVPAPLTSYILHFITLSTAIIIRSSRVSVSSAPTRSTCRRHLQRPT